MPRSGSRSCCATVGTRTIKTIGGNVKLNGNVIFENQKSKKKFEIIIKDAPSDISEFWKFLDAKVKETGIKDRKDWFIETFNVGE